MNDHELGRHSALLTGELRKCFADVFQKHMPPMTEQERFFIVMNSMSAFVSSMIDALINDNYPDNKFQMLHEFYETSRKLMEYKIKLEKEINNNATSHQEPV